MTMMVMMTTVVVVAITINDIDNEPDVATFHGHSSFDPHNSPME
jgi:hypothetical protein